MKHLIQFNRFMVTLVAMLTLSVTSAWGATHTGTFKKITSAADLTTGYYVVTASSSSTNKAYALGSTVNSNKRAEGVSVTITNDAITNPATTIVYYITKSDDGYSFKNESTGTYLYQAANTSGKGMGFNSSVKYLTLAGYNSSSPNGFKFTLNGASNNFFKWNNGSKWFANYANDYSTSQAPVELFKLASQTTITLDKNVNGTADGAVTYTVGNATPDATPEPVWVSSASSDYTLEGYYTAAEGGVKVINANNTLNTGATDYVDANGNWKYATTSTLKLYAQWQSSSDPQIYFDGTLEPFTYEFGNGPSEPQTIVLKGSNLTSNVIVEASDYYEFRPEDEEDYVPMLGIDKDAVMSDDGVTIYVRLSEGMDAGTYNGNLTATSDGADDAEIAFQGSVTPAPLTSIAAFIEEAPTTAREIKFTAESNAVITGRTTKNIYVQDASGKGIILFNNNGVPAWTVGNKIIGTIAGTYTTYNSMPELVLTESKDASAETAGSVTPVVLTEFTAANFADHACKLIKIEDVFFQSTSLSSNGVTVKNASETSFLVYNTFGTMTSKTLPLKEDAADVMGVYIAYGNSNPTYELAATAIDAGDAKMDVDPIGGADEASAVGIAPGGSVTITPISGFTTTVDGEAKTAITTVPVTEPTSITIASSRDFYTTKSVTYYYKVDQTIKAVTVNQPAEGGTIAADPTSAAVGATVELSYEAAPHYTFGSFSVMAGETPVAVNENEGVYTFTMPNADVTVTATFTENAKATASFAKGAEAATGEAPADIEWYIGEKFELPANTFSYAGNKFAGWSDGTSTYAAKDSCVMPEGGVTLTATWEQLSKWATTYTSNVTGIGTSNKVKIAGTDYNANKQNKGVSTSVTVPAGSTELHFHALAWKGEAQTITVAGSLPFAIVADDGVSGSGSTYTLTVDPSQVAYFSIPLTNITKDSVITFQAANNKRFVLFGVNAVQPAELTIDPTSYDFGSVKENASANKVFTVTPNAFVEGALTASFEGTDAAKFSAEVDGNNVTVTFTPAAQGAMAATLKVSATNANVTADLSGTGIAAATPEIVVPAEPVDFGKIKQDSAVADQQITVTLNNLDAATVAISGSTFSIDKTALVAGANTITISANTSVMGEVADTITISGDGAETKKIAVKIDVLSKWADTYTSNVGDDVLSDEVVIGGETYDAIKKGTGTVSQSAVISVPKGTQTLHFHAAAWNNESTVLVVKQGNTQLGSFSLYKDAGVKSSSPFTLQGNNYSTEQYFHVSVAAYTATDAADVTFTTTASPYRFVLYGVNQEGGIVPVLDSIKITGDAKTTAYEVGESFSTDGLKVMAYYSLEGVAQNPDDVTKDAVIYSTPATFVSTETTSVTVTAEFEGKSDNKDIAVTVTEPQPIIIVNPTSVSFGTVVLGAEVNAKTVAVTLANIESATVTLSGEGADAFQVTPASLTASGDITITPVTTNAGTFADTITISAEGAEPVKVAVSMSVVDLSNIRKETVDFTQVYASVDDNADLTKAPYNPYQGASFSITYAKGTNKNNGPKYYNNGTAVRAYEGNTLTIVGVDSILSVYVEWAGSYKDENLDIAYNAAEKSAVLTFSDKCRFTSLTVYYKYDEQPLREGLSVGAYGTVFSAQNIISWQGGKVYQIDYIDVDNSLLYFNEVEISEGLQGGKAYLFEATSAKIEVIRVGDDQPVVTDPDQRRGFCIAEAPVLVEESHTIYGLYGNKIQPIAQGVTIEQGRRYFLWSELKQESYLAPEAPVRRLAIGTPKSTPTDVVNVNANENVSRKLVIDNQFVIIRDGKRFNAQGQIVK